MTVKDDKYCVEVDFKITPGDSTINHALRADNPARSDPKTGETAPTLQRDSYDRTPSHRERSDCSMNRMVEQLCFFCPEDCKSLMYIGACLLVLILLPLFCAILGCFYCFVKL